MVAAALAPSLGSLLGISTAAATTAINVATYVGVTAASYFIQQSMQPKPEVGTKLQAASGGSVPQSMLVGEKECAGSLIYMGTWGKAGKTPNGYLVRVYALSDVPLYGYLSRVWCSGQKESLSGFNATVDGQNVGERVNGIDDLWVKIKLGDQTTADPYLTAKFGSHPTRPWTSDMIGRGRGLMIVTQRLNKKDQQSAWEVTPVLQGALFYDWRKDSTNGGSGSHRWGDYSTYEYSANPIVVAYNIMRGIYRGSTWLYGGLNWPARRLDVATWTAAANVCDENVSLSAGGTQKRYRMGAEILFNEQPMAVLDRIFASCNARLVETGGIYKVYAGGIGASVMSFTDSNIIVTESLSGTLFPQKEDIANTIAGSYVEPENGGQMKAYKKRTKTSYVDEDRGETRAAELNLEYVRENRQAQRLAKHALNDNRRFDTKILAFPPTARKLEPGDPVNWSSSSRFGYVNKKYIAGDTTLVRNGVVLVVCREVDSTDADWSTADEVSFSTDVLDAETDPGQTLTATASAVAITDDDNTTERAPAIRIQATLDDDFVDCKALLWQVRKRNGDKAVIAEGRSVAFFEVGNPKYGDIVFTNAAFKPGRQVQVRWKIEPESDRETSWSDDWSTTTTYMTLSSSALLTISTGTTTGDVKIVDTDNIKPGAILGGDSVTVRRKAWTMGSNGKQNKDLLPNSTKVANPTGSPLLVSWDLRAHIQFTLNEAGFGGGGASATVLLEIEHINSGRRVPIGKLEAKSKLKKNKPSRSFSGSFLFADARKEDAQFQIKATSTRNFAGLKYDKAKFVIDASEVEIRKWKR